MPCDPFSATPAGLRVAVRLTPRASANRIGAAQPDADGGAVLKVSVTAVPEDGKANAALIALLAKTWKLPKGAFAIVAGATERRKILLISGEAETLRRHIADRQDRA